MRFQVSATVARHDPAPATIPVAGDPDGARSGERRTHGGPGGITIAVHGFTYDPVPVELTLNEVVEPATFTSAGNTGRLLTLIGNRANPALLPFGAGGIYYFEPPTESVQYNTIRIWKIYNFTADAHPMHFHLFTVQILGRQRVDKTFLPEGPGRSSAAE